MKKTNIPRHSEQTRIIKQQLAAMADREGTGIITDGVDTVVITREIVRD